MFYDIFFAFSNTIIIIVELTISKGISCRFSNTVFEFAPQEYKVLSSAKVQILDFFMNKLFFNIFSIKGPSMEPCGIPHLLLDQLL